VNPGTKTPAKPKPKPPAKPRSTRRASAARPALASPTSVPSAPAPAPPVPASPPGAPPPAARPYAVGYGKPPVETRFRKGQSGNSGGRPVRTDAATLILDEAYRDITVQDGKRRRRLPAIQAILRSQVALAANGNGIAQRNLIAIVQAIEADRAAAAAAHPETEISLHDAARRIAFLLNLADIDEERQAREAASGETAREGAAAGEPVPATPPFPG
jgi:Family of unknown function (DUF5681)